jgi:hypothetical protein
MHCLASSISVLRCFQWNRTLERSRGATDRRYAQLFSSYNGWWQAFPPNPNKSVTVVGVTVNTWETWPSRYLPRNPASQNPHDYGYYDSGDPNVNDAQIRRMHDLGFTYIMFDITNGSHDWVDNRARAFMTRIRAWNNSLKPGQRPMYFCIALGNTRSTTTQASFLTTLESECQRAWNEFYSANLDIVYYLHGKPLVIHMLDSTDNNFWYSVTNWAGPRTNFDRLTNRTFREFDHYVGDAPYGWVVLPATPSQDPDLMTVQPGFGNGATYYPHNNGDRFKSHWNQVLQADPQSVFVVSWNEDWENNSIEPTYMNRTPAEAAWMGGEAHGKGYPGLTYWTDELGARMDDCYYEMTRLYLKIFLTGNIYQNTYLKEASSPDVYRAGTSGFIYQPLMPSQTPVLTVPDGFRTSFSGQFIPRTVDAYQFQITDATLATPNQVSLTFESWSGHRYEIFSGTNLNAIVQSEGTITATGPSTTFTKTGVNFAAPRFFRVVDRGVAP